MIKKITAGEKLYIGDFIGIRCGKAFRTSASELAEKNETIFMSANNYEKGQKATIFDEDAVLEV